jgi:3-oxoacyl-[acyl-carrier protein] reductase
MPLEINLEGKTALVAGGSSGIGLGIAQRLLQAGANVHVTGTRPAAEDYEESEFGELIFHSLEITDSNAVKSFADQFKKLDILIPSFGIVGYGGTEYGMDTFRNVIEVNLNGVMQICTCFRDLLSENKTDSGAIVIVGSTSSFIATPGQPAYSASKGALLTLTKSLAQAWAPRNLRVNGIAPGFVKTKLTKRSFEDEKVYEQTISRIPLKRWGAPNEMGDAAVFLSSPMSSYITGQMLLVDGGITLM